VGHLRVGLLARADDRGIGIQTWEFARNLEVERILVVREPGAERKGFMPRFDRYPDAETVTFDPRTGTLPVDHMEEFLDGLDVVYMVETPYDFRLFTLAEQAGVATVVHANPEFWRWDDPTLPRPTVWWLPTKWRADELPSECEIVPVPVPTAPEIPREDDGPLTALHVAGHRAAGDRNGTTTVFQTLRYLRSDRLRFRLECQDPRLPAVRSSRVPVERHLGGRADRWDLYAGADVLVLPRRYGGLCLPVLEAIAAGVVPVLPAVSPNEDWPAVTTPATFRGTLRTPGGEIPLAQTDPRRLAATLDDLADDEDRLLGALAEVEEFRRHQDWAALSGSYRAALSDAADRARR
jgi:hypothetical protein